MKPVNQKLLYEQMNLLFSRGVGLSVISGAMASTNLTPRQSVAHWEPGGPSNFQSQLQGIFNIQKVYAARIQA